MKANTISALFHENLLTQNETTGADFIVTEGTTPLIVRPASIQHLDGVAFQFITADAVRTIVVEAGDSVDESDQEWIFANGDFAATDVGGSITVTGATDAGNNGTFEIATVVGPTTITTVEIPGGDEVFDGTETLSVTAAAGAGDWTVEVSNDYVPAHLPGLNQLANVGHWSDITTEFFPTIAAVTGASNQPIQAYPLVFAYVRVTFTPTSGAAAVTVTYSAKGNR